MKPAKKTATDSTPAAAPYVVGFLFDESYSFVSLIRKNHPDWQAGLLNGIGGKVNDGETALAAMVREFAEETGLATAPEDWTHYLTMQGDEPAETKIGGSFRVDFFVALGPIHDLRTMTDEEVILLNVAGLWERRGEMIDNLPWAIALAMDSQQDGRPRFTTVNYPA